MYKIRNNKTGLYSKGGTRPKFSKDGKVFAKRNHVTSHMNNVNDKEIEYADCDVVEFEMVETGKIISALDWKPTESTIKANEAKERRYIQYRQELLRQKAERLQKELDEINSLT